MKKTRFNNQIEIKYIPYYNFFEKMSIWYPPNVYQNMVDTNLKAVYQKKLLSIKFTIVKPVLTRHHHNIRVNYLNKLGIFLN